MLRIASFAVGLLIICQAGFGQVIHTFYAGPLDPILIPSIAIASGFVITDVHSVDVDVDILMVQNGVTKLRIGVGTGGNRTINFTSGVSLTPNIQLDRGLGSTDGALVISGYVPGTRSAIPALGNVGLGILIATLAAAGGWIVSRRTGFARAE